MLLANTHGKRAGLRKGTEVPDDRSLSRPLPRGLITTAWISFILNVTIIATGGAVRLTGSGLGCSEWPLCTPDSLVPTPELGVHGIIEFGNRTISGPLALAAVLVVILTWFIRRRERGLFTLACVILGLVLAQAVVGGVLVWEELAAALVGFHYVVSVIIVCCTAAYVVLAYEARALPRRMRVSAVPRSFAILVHLTSLVLAITVFVGVLTTSAGPHSGDANVRREGFDASLLAHIHAWPGYALAVLSVVLIIWGTIQRVRPLPWIAVFLSAQLVQIAVGVYQARNGLPPLAVGIHMVLAALTAAVMTVIVLRLKRPVAHEEQIEGVDERSSVTG